MCSLKWTYSSKLDGLSNGSLFNEVDLGATITTFRSVQKGERHSQWALPSSGHPCPWSPPSSWGIGHLCPVWWQRGNCLNVHTTDTHTCLIHAFGLA